MAKIFLSLPILEKPEFPMIYSLIMSTLSCKGHQVRLYSNQNDSLISRVRNVHMSIFLNDYPDYDYFCSIDSDIEIVNCFATNNIFTKLIDADKDFVGGLYALKQYENEPRCSSIPLSNELNRSNIPFNKGLIEMLWLSAGCWMIKRSVLEKMVAAYPELTYTGDDNVAGKPIYGLCIPAIFEIESNGQKFKKYLSEDWAFCRRWKDIGGSIYADTSIVLRHFGRMPFSLWNVEVVSKKKDDIQTNLPPITANNGLPPAGFDLTKRIESAEPRISKEEIDRILNKANIAMDKANIAMDKAKPNLENGVK